MAPIGSALLKGPKLTATCFFTGDSRGIGSTPSHWTAPLFVRPVSIRKGSYGSLLLQFLPVRKNIFGLREEGYCRIP